MKRYLLFAGWEPHSNYATQGWYNFCGSFDDIQSAIERFDILIYSEDNKDNDGLLGWYHVVDSQTENFVATS